MIKNTLLNKSGNIGNLENFNSYKLSYKLAFIPFLSFRMKQKQESIFQEVGGLVTKNISDFCL